MSAAGELRGAWGRWTAVVAACALRKGSVPVDSADEYAALYKRVQTACRAAAEPHVGAEREFYEAMGRLAAPWVTLEVLLRADRELLDDLLRRCREAQDRLGGGRRTSCVVPAAVGVALLAVLLIVGLAALARGSAATTFSGRVGETLEGAWDAWRLMSDTQHALVVGGGAFLLALGVLVRLVRR